MIKTISKINDLLPIQDKYRLFVLFLLMLFAGILQITGLSLILGFISILSNPESLFEIEELSFVFQILSIQNSYDLLFWGSIILILIFIVKTVYLIFFNYIMARFANNKFRNISVQLFRTYMLAPYAYHGENNTAKLIRNITSETYLLLNFILLPILSILLEVFMIMSVMIFLIFVEPVITISAVASIGLMGFLLVTLLKKYEKKYGKLALISRADMIQKVNEGLGGIKEIKVLKREKFFIDQLKQSTNFFITSEIYNQVSKQSFRHIVETVAVVGMLFLALFMVFQGNPIESIIPILTLFGVAAFQLLPSIAKITNQISKLNYYGYAIDTIHADMTNTDLTSKNDHSEPIRTEKINFEKVIKIEDLKYSYSAHQPDILSGITLHVKKGKAIGIVGESGAGKTTLVDLLLGLYKPTSGTISVDNTDIFKNIGGWQKLIGYIPQSIFLSDASIKENIAFGIEKSKIDSKRIQEVIELAHLSQLVSDLPNGIETNIGERGSKLSGGQKQRIGIARALYHNPELLIMDEATSALDNKTEHAIISTIEKLKGTKTLIIIAHRLTTIEHCDTVYVLEAGKIAAEGSYSDLTKNSEVFRKIANYD